MNLLVDIGNSRIKWALTNGNTLGELGAIVHGTDNATYLLREAWQPLDKPEKISVANVAGAEAEALVRLLSEQLWSLVPDFARVERSCCGVTNAYDDIGQLGVDRWLAILAAWSMYRKPLCVISVGTALTIDIVDNAGRHLGGYIIPGPVLMQESLIDNTSGIAVPVTEEYELCYGKNTIECIRNGAALAAVAAIEKNIADMKQEYSTDMHCVISGGGAVQLKTLLSVDIDYEPQLVLKGLLLLQDNGT